jgi:GNAT superfamily N-acetyltransferase
VNTTLSELAPDYSIRAATPIDIPVLVHQRLSMFNEMGITVDAPTLSMAFDGWLKVHLPTGTYRAWLVEHQRVVVAGGGITLLTWPPGPREHSGRLPIVYNVYTESPHRRRGLAKALMETIQDWCRTAGYNSVGLAASADGRRLYQSLGYQESQQPYMFLAL